MLAFMMLACCGDAICYQVPEQLDDGITTGSLTAAGFKYQPIEALLQKARISESSQDTGQGQKRGYQELHSLLIYKDGLLVLEEYYFGNNDHIQFENNITRDRTPKPVQWSRDKKHYIASVNKALTATVTGIALDQLDLTTSSRISSLLPNQYEHFFRDGNKAEVTIADLLTMQSGFVWDEWQKDDLAQLWHSTDFSEFVLGRPNLGPGSEWQYNSAGPNLLLRALQHQLDQPLREWAGQQFYDKLGITDYDWQSQPGGYPEGSARMHMRPRDMLKVGITYLNQGKWQGQQVIPVEWVNEIFKVQAGSEAGDYSYLFWLRELNGISYLSADGDGGQYINIFPGQNMVIVMTQGNYLEWPLYVKQADDIMANYIFKAL